MLETRRWPRVAIAVAFFATVGCGDDDGMGMPMPGTDAGPGVDTGPMPAEDGGPPTLPTAPPTSLTRVTSEGFHSPTDAVASLDGTTFYFAAFTVDGDPAIFSVPSAGGAPAALHTGDPLQYPSGLVLSCDGSTLYIADAGAEMAGAEDRGAVYSMPVAGAAPTPLSMGELWMPNALAFDEDCSNLYISARDMAGNGAVHAFSGGTLRSIFSGAPLVAPTGIHVDVDHVAWVLDHLAEGAAGTGVLWAIEEGEMPVEVASGLRLGTPGGVSLTAGGGNAVIGARDADGNGQLLTVNLATMETATVTSPELVDPAGLRTARGAGVFAVADSEGGAIFRAE